MREKKAGRHSKAEWISLESLSFKTCCNQVKFCGANDSRATCHLLSAIGDWRLAIRSEVAPLIFDRAATGGRQGTRALAGAGRLRAEAPVSAKPRDHRLPQYRPCRLATPRRAGLCAQPPPPPTSSPGEL